MIRSTTISRATQLSALGATALLSTSAFAVDWNGYFRAGPGATDAKTVSRACYGLGGPGLKYRLGNECDIFGEFELSQGLTVDGIDYKAVLMTTFYRGATDVAGDTRSQLGQVEQLYVEGKGYDILPEASFWVGKERGRRGDVHIVDTFFTEMAGVGGGVKGISAGPGKLGVAYYRSDNDGNNAGNRVNVEYYDIGVNPGGKLSFVGTLTKVEEGAKGGGLSARHVQKGFLGGDNSLWVQYARGTAALNSNFGSVTADSRTKSWRIVESPGWQAGPFGGQAMVLWGQTEAPDVNGKIVKTTDTSVGGRISYALTKNFKLLGKSCKTGPPLA